MPRNATTIVFLHIPKTAGQTVHSELARVVGEKQVSPVRVHTQAPNGPQMPAGYRLYSGHIDWVELDTLPQDRFVFSVLRDPRERIASFYFYLLKEAKALSETELKQPGNTGKRFALERSADDYFFSGEKPWLRFIADHYDNFYCSYFATRKMRGFNDLAGLDEAEILARARTGLENLDRVYHTSALQRLEEDVLEQFGAQIRVAGNYVNEGAHTREQKRWPKLMERLERDDSRQKLEAFAARDEALMQQIDFA